MILIGQYDSPFVRRVGVALRLYDLPFTHQPWSAFGDAARLRDHNPLRRVPTLVLDDGTALIDSHVILDYLDHLAPADRVLAPRDEPARHRVLRVAAFAVGVADKLVSLFYERRLHAEVSPLWVERCQTQIAETLALLEGEAAPAPYWFGAAPTHADVAIAAMWRFAAEAHPGLIAPSTSPRLADLAARLEALPVFQEIQQPFLAPA